MADRTWTGRIVLKGESKGVGGAFNKASKSANGFSKSLGNLAKVAGPALLGAALVSTINVNKKFEKSISSLAAITGAAGKDLDKLSDASKRIGQTTTLSATQASEAFQLMASAKPDLLSNLDALEATTLAAVTLAEAAGLELPQAATALGESLNQFGKGAEDAERFINVLAASSQKGASLINEVNLAMKGAGVAASQAGLSFEATNAQIQTLAFAGIKGAEAGTKLRTVLVKLQTQANDNFNPAVVGINDALKNLEIANLGVTERTKLFGEEALITADILIGAADASAQLTRDITGTNTAQEQAQTNTDNLDGSLKRMSSAIEAVQLSFTGTNGATRILVDTFTDIINTIAALNSEGSPGSINVLSGAMEVLAFSFKTVFTAGIVLKNMLDNIFEVVNFVARSLIDLLSGNFDLIDDNAKAMVEAINGNEEDIGRAAAGIWNPELAAEVDANMREYFMEPSIAVAKETAEAVADVAATAGETEAARLAAEAEKLAETEAEREAARIERLIARNLTEREMALENFSLRIAQNQELFDLELISEEQHQERKVLLAQSTADRLMAIDRGRAKQAKKWDDLSNKQKVMGALAVAGQLASNFSGTSKKMFKVQKAAALAQAVVALPASVMSSFQNGGGYPWGLIPAGLMLAQGLNEINTIKSSTFGGGGGGGGGLSTGGASASIPSGAGVAPDSGGLVDVPLGGPGAGGAVPTQDITIKIDGLDEGGLLSADQVRALMGSISEQIGDGVEIDTGG